VNAIEELAHQIVRLHALEDRERGITVNVGVVKGGTRENVVAAHAEALIDVRAEHGADQQALDEHLRSLAPVLGGTRLALEGGITRPPLEPTPAAERLLAKAREHARGLGLDLGGASSGGGSDGNLVAAVGVPVLDGLGAEGSGAHAEHERVFVDSLPVRAQLLARLLEDPGL
jgi:glutamate carboxypeptidase